MTSNMSGQALTIHNKEVYNAPRSETDLAFELKWGQWYICHQPATFQVLAALPKGTGSAQEVYRTSRGSPEEVQRKSRGSPEEVHRKSKRSPQEVQRKSTERPHEVYRKSTLSSQGTKILKKCEKFKSGTPVIWVYIYHRCHLLSISYSWERYITYKCYF